MPDDASAKPNDQLLADRRRKLDRLRDEFGVDPYGHRLDGVIDLAAAAARYDEAADLAHKEDPQRDERPTVRVAGRVMQHRVMGNLIFMQLRDATGDLQVAVSKKAVGQPAFSIAKMADYGDIVAAEGPLAKTKTGEVTVWCEPARPRAAGGDPSEPARPRAAVSDAEGVEEHAGPGTARLAGGFAILTKSLALPPGKHHGLTDAETRYRKRYVDLYSNPEVMRTMQLRIRIIDEIRQYLRDRGFFEVETPMLQTLHGGAAARPFTTHHNALDLPLTLRIAPELYLKRLLVGGMPRVFEINRNFRNEGVSPRHNPEFTMLEAYEAYGSWETMADLVEDMICTVAERIFGTLKIEHGADAPGVPASVGMESTEDSEDLSRQDAKTAKRTIDLSRPWRRISMVELVAEYTEFLGCRWDFDKRPLELTAAPILYGWLGCAGAMSAVGAQQLANRFLEIGHNPSDALRRGSLLPKESRVESTQRKRDELAQLTPAEQLVEVYEKLIEPTLINPTFVTHVPSVIIPLAKKNAEDPYFADVYELAINGVEISPGYSELNDPEVQEANFREQVGDEAEQQQIDDDFLEALRVGMPPAGGMGLGIDRLVMMLTGAESIRDVILFPLMRPVGEGTKARRHKGTEGGKNKKS